MPEHNGARITPLRDQRHEDDLDDFGGSDAMVNYLLITFHHAVSSQAHYS